MASLKTQFISKYFLLTSYNMKRSWIKDIFEDGPKAKIFIKDFIQENPDLWDELIPEEWLDVPVSEPKQIHRRDGRTTKKIIGKLLGGSCFETLGSSIRVPKSPKSLDADLGYHTLYFGMFLYVNASMRICSCT